MTGPLNGLKIVELGGIGPAPFATMALADAGADVIRIDRPYDEATQNDLSDPLATGRAQNVMNRGRRSLVVDLKQAEAAEAILTLVEHADAIIEGFRPGVAERLGVGPESCAARNPRLIYGRVTGWGRSGPLAHIAGHDINYIALSGTLGAIGPSATPPVPPLNLLGDFTAGILLAYGVTCALFEAGKSGRGQIVDVAMVDGAAYLATYIHGLRALGLWNDERESNVLDGGAPFYRIYSTKDGGYLAVGAIEERFFVELLDLVGLGRQQFPHPGDRAGWSALSDQLTDVFARRTRHEWEEIFAGSNACVAPVLSMGEATTNDHLVEWGTFIKVDGVVQPAPTPRFSRTPSSLHRTAPLPSEGGAEALQDWGLSDYEIKSLLECEAVNPQGPLDVPIGK